MYRTTVILGLTLFVTGCQSGGILRDFGHPCPTGDCGQATSACEDEVVLPQQEIEVQTPSSVVVRAPRQEIIVESPPPVTVPARPTAPPGCHHAGGHAVAMAGYPNPHAMAPVRARVRRRTGLGFKLTTINIPIPFLKPIAVEEPDEVTYEIPAAAYAPPMYAPPMPMVQGYPAYPPAQPMMQYAAPMPMTGMAVGQGQVVVRTEGVAATQVQAAAQGQPPHATEPAAVLPPPVTAPCATPPAAPTSVQDKLLHTQQQLEELQRLCEELKQQQSGSD